MSSDATQAMPASSMVGGAVTTPPMPTKPKIGPDRWWAIAFVAPYLLVFVLFVVYPLGYGLWIGTEARAYQRLFSDPIFLTTVWNTVVFLLIAVNLKMVIALFLSGFLARQEKWIQVVGIVFLIAWAMPSIPSILSVRWMFNPEWGMVNNIIFSIWQVDGPGWLTERHWGMTLAIYIHIWKSLPFWTLIMIAARLAIPKDYYEAAAIDGASKRQTFWFITWPMMRTTYLTSVLLSTIWSLGDFNSVFLLTGGGPADLTQVLATLGIRYLRMDQLEVAMAAVIVALPFMLPLVFVLMKYLSQGK